MAVPENLLSIQDPDRFFRKTGIKMSEEAEIRTGRSFDLDAWESELLPIEYDLVVLGHFLGTWENSGSFVNEAKGWWPEGTRVKRALVAFDCEKTAAIFDEAAELGMQIANRYDSDQDITPEQAAQREQMNQAANEDVSYEKLAAFIRKHHSEFFR